MSANQSPSNFRDPTAQTHARHAKLLASSALFDPISGSTRTKGQSASRPLTTSLLRRELATVTERAASPSTMRRDHRNSQFRFEVPARIACQGGKCRRLRCDATGPGRLIPAGSRSRLHPAPPPSAVLPLKPRSDFQPCSPRACIRTEHRVSERRAPCLSAPRQPVWRLPLQRFQARRSLSFRNWTVNS